MKRDWDLRSLLRKGVALGATSVLVMGLGLCGAQAVCTDPPGDVNGSGSTNVADALCSMLVSNWQALVNGGLADPAVPPGCLSGPIYNADANCDGIVNVQDAILVVALSLGNPLSMSIDANQNKCVDVCESVNLPGPPVVVPAFVHGVSTGGGLRLQALGTGASAVGSSTGTVGGQDLNLQPHPVAK